MESGILITKLLKVNFFKYLYFHTHRAFICNLDARNKYGQG